MVTVSFILKLCTLQINPSLISDSHRVPQLSPYSITLFCIIYDSGRIFITAMLWLMLRQWSVAYGGKGRLDARSMARPTLVAGTLLKE